MQLFGTSLRGTATSSTPLLRWPGSILSFARGLITSRPSQCASQTASNRPVVRQASVASPGLRRGFADSVPRMLTIAAPEFSTLPTIPAGAPMEGLSEGEVSSGSHRTARARSPAGAAAASLSRRAPARRAARLVPLHGAAPAAPAAPAAAPELVLLGPLLLPVEIPEEEEAEEAVPTTPAKPKRASGRKAAPKAAGAKAAGGKAAGAKAAGGKAAGAKAAAPLAPAAAATKRKRGRPSAAAAAAAALGDGVEPALASPPSPVQRKRGRPSAAALAAQAAAAAAGAAVEDASPSAAGLTPPSTPIKRKRSKPAPAAAAAAATPGKRKRGRAAAAEAEAQAQAQQRTKRRKTAAGAAAAEAAAGASSGRARRTRKVDVAAAVPAVAAPRRRGKARPIDPLPFTEPTPELLAGLVGYRPPPLPVPNLGYACLNETLRELKPPIFISRDCIKKTLDAKGLPHLGELCLANCRDLARIIQWNHENGIRLFRLSSVLFPWMGTFKMSDLPNFTEVAAALRFAGDLARAYGQRLTFHPSHFCKLAAPSAELVQKTIAELEAHSTIMDLMGYSPSPENKINIHVGGQYGSKADTILRFAENYRRLSPNCRARLTVENDDVSTSYSTADLLDLHRLTGIPIVFDFHHHKFCTGGMTEREAFLAAVATWPADVRPVVHWSESQEGRKPHAHSDYVEGPIFLHGLEGQVDVMIEAKAKEKALLRYRATLPAAGAAAIGQAVAAPVLAPAEEGQADIAEPMEAEAA